MVDQPMHPNKSFRRAISHLLTRTPKCAVALLISTLLASFALSACTSPDLENETISVYSREDGSGTRGAFASLFGLETKLNGKTVDTITPSAVVTNSTAVMMTSVASDPAAIGYISYGSLNDTVKALAIDGVVPTTESIKDKSYKVFRAFSLVTDEPIDDIDTADETQTLKADFMRFVASAEGQAIIEEAHFVGAVDDPVNYDRAPASMRPSGKLVIAGSSSVAGVMEKLAEAYEQLNPDASIEVQQSDSTTGIAMVGAHTCDIGMISRDLTQSEQDSGIVATPLAFDGIAVIVNPNLPLDDMTSQEVARIFSGDITTFGELPSWQQSVNQTNPNGA
ncbi:substrate-binding domain-containing protein [Eggerthellaceae bacterium 3-80]